MKTKSVLIATPLFPPDIGGPAKHAQALQELLEKKEISTKVVSFSSVRKLPVFIRHIIYIKLVFVKSFSANTIIALDEFSVGFPAAINALLLRKKLIVRIGGDRLWEKAVQAGRYEKPLPFFCEERQAKKLFPLQYRLVRFVLRQADTVVFPSSFYRGMAVILYDIPLEKTSIIENENLPFVNLPMRKREPLTFIYAGRFTKVKNLPRMISAFNSFAKENPGAHLFLYGEGPEETNLKAFSSSQITIAKPLSHSDLLNTIARAQTCVLPSLSEVSPNFLFECDAIGVPTIVTKYAGGVEKTHHTLAVDPVSDREILDAFYRSVSFQSTSPTSLEKTNYESAWLSVLEK